MNKNELKTKSRIIDNRFLTEFSKFTFGRIVFSISQFLIVVIIANLGTPAEVGLWGYALAINGPIYMFFSMQLRTLLATENNAKFTFNNYLNAMDINLLLAFITVIMISIFTADVNVKLFTIVSYSIVKTIQSIGELIYGELQHEDKIVIIGRSNTIKGIASTFAFFIIYYLFGNLNVAIITIAVTWAIVIVLHDLRYIKIDNIKTFKYIEHLYEIKSIFKMALPLGIISLLYSLAINITRYQVDLFVGIEMLGVFTASAYLTRIGYTFVGALGQALSKNLAIKFKVKNNFYKIVFYLIIIGMSLGIVTTMITYFLGDYVLSYVYSANYISDDLTLTILMASTVFKFPSEFLAYATIITRKHYEEIPQLILANIVIFITGYIMIPVRGIEGAAIAILIGSVITFIGRVDIVYRNFRG